MSQVTYQAVLSTDGNTSFAILNYGRDEGLIRFSARDPTRNFSYDSNKPPYFILLRIDGNMQVKGTIS